MAFKVGVVGGALTLTLTMAGNAQAQAQGPAAQPAPVAPTVQPAPPPPGYGPTSAAPGQPTYAPAPYVAPPPPASPLGRGITLEANLGVGWLRITSDEGDSEDSDSGLGGLNVGIGGWVSPRAALSLRIAGVTYSEGGNSVTGGFVGGALQYWTTENFWLGGGVGVGFASLELEGEPAIDPETGLGLDLRVGYTPLIGGQNSLNFSFEVNPSFLDGGTLTGIALLVGYQYL